jgi:phage N-6-adenine-methyltransferase
MAHGVALIMTTLHDLLISSVSSEHPTPRRLVTQLAREFAPGGFDLDPCASADNAKAPRFYAVAEDGLSQPWTGRIWLNPPFGREIGAWLRRAAQAGAEGHLVVALVPARSTGTQWWMEATAAASLPRFIPGRLVNPETGRQWMIPAAILVFGPVQGRHGPAAVRCKVCREIFWPARLPADTCSDRCRKALSRSRIKAICVTSQPRVANAR